MSDWCVHFKWEFFAFCWELILTQFVWQKQICYYEQIQHSMRQNKQTQLSFYHFWIPPSSFNSTNQLSRIHKSMFWIEYSKLQVWQRRLVRKNENFCSFRVLGTRFSLQPEKNLCIQKVQFQKAHGYATWKSEWAREHSAMFYLSWDILLIRVVDSYKWMIFYDQSQ